MQNKEILKHILETYEPGWFASWDLSETTGTFRDTFARGVTMDELPNELANAIEAHPIEMIASLSDGDNVLYSNGQTPISEAYNHFDNFKVSPRNQGLTFNLEFTEPDSETKSNPNYDSLSNYVITLSPARAVIASLEEMHEANEPPEVMKMAVAMAEDPEYVNWDGSYSDKYYVEAAKLSKKEVFGLNHPAVQYGMNGSLKSDYADNAGIVVVEFDKDSDIGKVLRDNTSDIETIIGDDLGLAENNSQHIFISKDVVMDDKASVAILYSDTLGADANDFDSSLRTAINTVAKSESNNTFNIVPDQYKALDSQIKNAKERYNSNDGTWAGKINKSIIVPTANPSNVSLNESLINENQGIDGNEVSGPDVM